jgi:hypothetical protein
MHVQKVLMDHHGDTKKKSKREEELWVVTAVMYL